MSRSLTDLLLRGWVIVCLVFMLAPGLLVVLFSFNTRAIMAFPFDGPSLRWYSEVLNDSAVIHGLRNSLVIAFGASISASVLGTAAAMAVVRSRPSVATLFSTVLALPMIIPALILGISLATMFSAAGIVMSPMTAILGHTILLVPLTFAFVAARLAGFDWTVEEASRDLGAGPTRTFFRVVLPAIKPAIIGACAIAMAFSLDEFVVTFFIIGIDHTLPTLLWSKMRFAMDPSINVIGTFLLLLSGLVIAFGVRFGTVRL